MIHCARLRDPPPSSTGWLPLHPPRCHRHALWLFIICASLPSHARWLIIQNQLHATDARCSTFCVLSVMHSPLFPSRIFFSDVSTPHLHCRLFTPFSCMQRMQSHSAIDDCISLRCWRAMYYQMYYPKRFK